MTWLLVRAAVVAVLVLLVRRRRQAQAVTAVLVCKVRSPARQSFMAVERVAVEMALPVLVALEQSVVATVVVVAVVAVVSLQRATAGMVRKAQSSLNTGTLLELSTGLAALALGIPQAQLTGRLPLAVPVARVFPAWAIMWYSMPALTAAQVLL